jgi:hypothetical protein
MKILYNTILNAEDVKRLKAGEAIELREDWIVTYGGPITQRRAIPNGKDTTHESRGRSNRLKLVLDPELVRLRGRRVAYNAAYREVLRQRKQQAEQATAPRPYRCSKCKEAFRNPQGAALHYRRVHGDLKGDQFRKVREGRTNEQSL